VVSTGLADGFVAGGNGGAGVGIGLTGLGFEGVGGGV